MAIQEIGENELQQELQSGKEKEAVLFYTALCGTCKLAERMLEIVEATADTVPIRKININYAPVLRDSWKIASVPCLVLLERGEPVRFEYAMQSVGHLYGLLRR